MMCGVKIYAVVHIKLNQLVYEMLARLQLTNKAYLSAIRVPVTSIFQSFTYKMAAKPGWHRYGTKLRHCDPMYSQKL